MTSTQQNSHKGLGKDIQMLGCVYAVPAKIRIVQAVVSLKTQSWTWKKLDKTVLMVLKFGVGKDS